MFKWLRNKLGNNSELIINSGRAVDNGATKENRDNVFARLAYMHSTLILFTKRDTNNIVTLTLPVRNQVHVGGESTKAVKTYYFRYENDGEIYQYYPQTFMANHSSALLCAVQFDEKRFYEAEIKHIQDSLVEDDVDFKVLKLGHDIPTMTTAETAKVLRKQKPGTYSHFWNGNYLREIKGDTLYLIDKNTDCVRVVTDWQMDLVRYVNKEPVFTPPEVPAYIIANYETVDRLLIPTTDSRRWMVITELEGSDSKWCVQVIPKNIAHGKVRNFKIEFVFDQIDIGGVVFDSLQMIDQAVTRCLELSRKNQVPVERQRIGYVGSAYGVAFNNDPDYVLDIDNIYVTHDNTTLSYRGYILQQNKSATFKDKKPYLSPFSPAIRVNDQVIGFDEKGKLVNYYQYECIGDTIPDGKKPYH